MEALGALIEVRVSRYDLPGCIEAQLSLERNESVQDFSHPSTFSGGIHVDDSGAFESAGKLSELKDFAWADYLFVLIKHACDHVSNLLGCASNAATSWDLSPARVVK